MESFLNTHIHSFSRVKWVWERKDLESWSKEWLVALGLSRYHMCIVCV